jgi:toxin-antitoxin system PIN domain toxin
MIIPDVNLLIYTYNQASPHYPSARNWWENCMQQEAAIGLSWLVIAGFIRLMTSRYTLKQPASLEFACATVENWLQQPNVRVLNPGENFVKTYLRLLRLTGSGGNLTTDAFLAALAIEYQAELHSRDADFARFPGLRWINPLTVNR